MKSVNTVVETKPKTDNLSERFRCLIPSYLGDCHVILVRFDVNHRGSLDSVPDWIELGRKERFERLKQPLIVLVGNKVDDSSRQQVNSNLQF